ncbi:anti-sigma factor antagonist [Sphingobacteriales bacterium UPWRP_1]|nr:hypothetical protein BVG80_09090 [Sphingobacteriales bacterium TSM_CSM]PSJ73727.1 anti-sigma factor antagonist [Sphingobacteriales bacterium UPWRP_1]
MQFNLSNLNNSTALLCLQGSLLEQHALPALLAAIKENTHPQTINFIVDLQQITGMNSSGLNLLLQLLTKSRNTGGETILVHLPQTLQNLLVVTKLNQIFTTAQTLEQALQLLGQPTNI